MTEMSLLDRYTKRINQQFETVEKTQREAIVAVGTAMAKCVEQGGAVHTYDTGHIIDSELIGRGGGLMLLQRLKFDLSIINEVFDRDRSKISQSVEGLAGYALRLSQVMPGDMLFIGSVSGKSEAVVDLAIEAKKFGLTVVALTSVAYSSSVPSLHSSGKRLFEVADYVLDNCAPLGEGMVEIPGIPAHFGAASGLSAALIMWSVCAQAVDQLMADGVTPSIYMSDNVPGGMDYNAKLLEHYKKTGV